MMTGAASTIVQYVVVRTDLVTSLGWPLGALIAQGCHATSAVAHLFAQDPQTQQYFADLDNMHKVVLGISGEEKIRNLAKKLEEGGVQHKLWIEQPENTPTCIATKPCAKTEVQQYFRKLQLFRLPEAKKEGASGGEKKDGASSSGEKVQPNVGEQK